MNECSLEFIGIRKHFVFDKRYIVRVWKDKITMGTSKLDPNAKYTIPLSLQTKIGWHLDATGKALIAFSFSYKEVVKVMHSNPTDLCKFKELIRCQVVYQKISDFFEPKCIIGKGGSARVLLAKNTMTAQFVAVKSIEKSLFLEDANGRNNLNLEIEIMNQLAKLPEQDQRQFISFYEVYEGDQTVYLIMQLLEGRTLSEEIDHYRNQQFQAFKKEDVKLIIKQLLTGLAVIHEQRIIHRDIKPENLMFVRKGSEGYGSLKIVDFGLSTKIDVEKYHYPRCGTPGYVAPEILQLKNRDQKYGPQCDVFSAGAIFYKLLLGRSLFSGRSFDDIYKKNRECLIDYDSPEFQQIDVEAKQLLEEMLEKDPNQRISAREALNHPYFKDYNAFSIKLISLFTPVALDPEDFIKNSCSIGKLDDVCSPFTMQVQKIHQAKKQYELHKVEEQFKEDCESKGQIESDSFDIEIEACKAIEVFRFPNFKKPHSARQKQKQVVYHKEGSLILIDDQGKDAQLEGKFSMQSQQGRQLSTNIFANNSKSLIKNTLQHISFRNNTLNSFYIKDPLSPARRKIQKHETKLGTLMNIRTDKPTEQKDSVQ